MSYITKRIRLVVPSNKAKPSPQIGQALGSLGINMMKFCKEFNAQTVKYADDLPMRVKLYSYSDGSYNFTIHLPQTSWFLKKSARIHKGTGRAAYEDVGFVHCKQLYEIAKLKHHDCEDSSVVSLPNIFKTIRAQCASMGIKVDYRTETDFQDPNKAKALEKTLAQKLNIKK